jgi:hypothetical protein
MVLRVNSITDMVETIISNTDTFSGIVHITNSFILYYPLSVTSALSLAFCVY